MSHRIRSSSSFLAVLVCLGLATGLAVAEDWSQWRGPERSGEATAFEPPAEWPSELTLTWEVEVGKGDSSPLVSDDVVYVFSRVNEAETVSAYRLGDGERLWRTSYEAPFKPLTIVGEHGAGPYSTPLVAGGRLFTLGITAVLTAWSVEDGAQLWQKDVGSEFKFARPFYGASQAPMLADGKLIVHLGGPGDGALMAIDPATGREIWRLPGDGPAYGSPILVEREGVRQIVTLTQGRAIGVDLESGRLLWETPFKVSIDTTSLTPLEVGESIVLSGNQIPTRAYRVSKKGDSWSVDEVWSNDQLSMMYSSPISAGGRIVGFVTQNKGQVVALDPDTGEVVWEGPGRFGENAWLLAAGDTVIAIRDDATMWVFSASADAFEPLAQYELANSSIWAHPALLQRHLLIKDRDHLRLWEIPPA